MGQAEYRIRTLAGPEVEVAIDWAAAEGWNPGLQDAVCFYAADSDGFFVGELDGEPVGCISAVKYGSSFGFIGLYIVRPEYRGRGYGFRLWRAAMAYLDGRNIGLDGVVEQQDNYRKSGFVLAYRNVRYAGEGGGAAPDAAGVVPLGDVPFAEVEALDRELFPAERRAFLQQWLAQPGGTALGLRGEDGQLAGYGVLRRCREGARIGPLFAATPAQAAVLFQALGAAAPAGEVLYLDVPEVNHAAVELAERHDMTPVFETARMYTGPAPDLPLERVFGVTTFELG